MSFRKQSDETSANSHFYLLDGSKNEHTQLFIKMVKTDNLREVRAWLENMILLVCLHQSPITGKTKIADGVKCGLRIFLIVKKESSLFQNVYLLLDREQLFSVSHKRIDKKWPALVRCIPCGREAVAGSIDCKGTTIIPICQIFWQKSA